MKFLGHGGTPHGGSPHVYGVVGQQDKVGSRL